MKKLNIGDKAPAFKFDCTDPNITTFKDLLGKNVVLYFYPRDNTPGCTTESNDFNNHLKHFSKLNTQVIGVSKDSLQSHNKFCSKLDLTFPLISDPDGKLCEYFDVLIEKNIFMKMLLGIERSTFLIDSQGKIQHIWRKVKVSGHVDEVLQILNALQLNA